MEQKQKEIIVKNIAKSYAKRIVLKNVSINIKQGETVSLLGPNGAGKSTLMKIMTGVYTKDSGKVIIKGEEEEIKRLQD